RCSRRSASRRSPYGRRATTGSSRARPTSGRPCRTAAPPEPPPVTRGRLIGKTGCAGKSPRANRGESDRFLGPPGARKPKGAGGARSEERQAEPPALALPRLRAEGPQHHAVARRDLAAARQELPEPLLPLRAHRPRPPLHLPLPGPP